MSRLVHGNVEMWCAEKPPKQVLRSLERLSRIEGVVRVVAMPDVHLAKEVCVGAVMATASRLFPEAVGGDIGCGMSALRFEADARALDDAGAASEVLGLLGETIPCTQRPSRSASLPGELSASVLSEPRLEKKKASIGRVQFATLGRGNHFIEFQRGEASELWLMIHSGSRGMGQAIRDVHLLRAQASSKGLRFLESGSEEGQAYLADMRWAVRYARQSRCRMAELIAEGMHARFGFRAVMDGYFDCSHNFVRREEHDGHDLWVHRKGAISAAEGELGIIPGSMASASFHVSGRGQPDALKSSSHGAGRLLSRTDARRKVTIAAFQEQMQGVWFDHRLTNRLRDEAPAAYKNIGAVMRAQRDLTRIVRQLEPVLSYKGW